MNSYAIEVKSLKKSYKKTEVLKDVNFKVKRGDIFGLLGAIGAGKTTIIRILSTLIRQDDGSVIVNGFDVLKNLTASDSQSVLLASLQPWMKF